MDAYQKVQKKKEETAENEIRVAVQGQVSSYLGYAFRILNPKSDHKSLTIRATGNAIVKALILIELVKRRIGDLHQLNKIHSMVIVDVYQPKVEGLEPIEQNRRVTALDCILSKEPLDSKEVGYQVPEPKEERVQQPHKRIDKERGEKPQFNKERAIRKPIDKEDISGDIRGRGGRGRRGIERGARRGGPRQYNPDRIDRETDRNQKRRDASPVEERRRGGFEGRGRGGRGRVMKRYNDDYDVKPRERVEPTNFNDQPRRPRVNYERESENRRGGRRGGAQFDIEQRSHREFTDINRGDQFESAGRGFRGARGMRGNSRGFRGGFEESRGARGGFRGGFEESRGGRGGFRGGFEETRGGRGGHDRREFFVREGDEGHEPRQRGGFRGNANRREQFNDREDRREEFKIIEPTNARGGMRGGRGITRGGLTGGAESPREELSSSGHQNDRSENYPRQEYNRFNNHYDKPREPREFLDEEHSRRGPPAWENRGGYDGPVLRRGGARGGFSRGGGFQNSERHEDDRFGGRGGRPGHFDNEREIRNQGFQEQREERPRNFERERNFDDEPIEFIQGRGQYRGGRGGPDRGGYPSGIRGRGRGDFPMRGRGRGDFQSRGDRGRGFGEYRGRGDFQSRGDRGHGFGEYRGRGDFQSRGDRGRGFGESRGGRGEHRGGYNDHQMEDKDTERDYKLAPTRGHDERERYNQ